MRPMGRVAPGPRQELSREGLCGSAYREPIRTVLPPTPGWGEDEREETGGREGGKKEGEGGKGREWGGGGGREGTLHKFLRPDWDDLTAGLQRLFGGRCTGPDTWRNFCPATCQPRKNRARLFSRASKSGCSSL